MDVPISVVVGHMHCGILLDALRPARVADVAAEPGGFPSPIDVLVRVTGVLTPAGETECLKAHRFECYVPGENHQIGPRNLASILLLNRPKKPARLVQANVVRPTVDRCETLLAPAAAAATVANAVSAGAMPRHSNEQPAVVAEVRRPPVLRIGHQRGEIFFHRSQVEALKLFRVVEALAHGIGLGRMLAEKIESQLIWPPVAVRRAAGGVVDGAFGFG